MMVYVHFAEGFEEIEALMVVDVLRRAEIDVKMVSMTGQQMVVGAHGISVRSDVLFEDADYNSCEMIVLPGGMPGTHNLNAHVGLKARISEFHAKKKWLAAICAAPMVYGSMGLLKNQSAVCYPGWEEHCEGAIIKDASVVVSGHFITGKSIGTAAEFALGIVGVLRDEILASKIASKMHLKSTFSPHPQ